MCSCDFAGSNENMDTLSGHSAMTSVSDQASEFGQSLFFMAAVLQYFNAENIMYGFLSVIQKNMYRVHCFLGEPSEVCVF